MEKGTELRPYQGNCGSIVLSVGQELERLGVGYSVCIAGFRQMFCSEEGMAKME